MIEVFEIKNFKSIKDLKLTCSRINIFIGEPNTGKSNILEALGLFSFVAYGDKSTLKKFVRHENITNLFFDNDIEKKIEIQLKLHNKDSVFFEIFLIATGFIRGRIEYHYKDSDRIKKEVFLAFELDYDGAGKFTFQQKFRFVKFYRFEKLDTFPARFALDLLPLNGLNLLSVLMSHKDIKNNVSNLLAPYGYKLMFKPQENKIEIVKQYDDIFISIPYSLISDTFQRLIFYLTSTQAAKDSVLVFEEPEVHTFPYYTKFLAETIALDDKNNQFFISTHNPYFLFSILEKGQKKDVSIFVVYMENFETKVKKLTQKEIEEAMDIGLDFFFNLDRFKNEEQTS